MPYIVLRLLEQRRGYIGGKYMSVSVLLLNTLSFEVMVDQCWMQVSSVSPLVSEIICLNREILKSCFKYVTIFVLKFILRFNVPLLNSDTHCSSRLMHPDAPEGRGQRRKKKKKRDENRGLARSLPQIHHQEVRGKAVQENKCGTECLGSPHSEQAGEGTWPTL